MTQFEDDLRRALRVENVPEDLAERVIARIDAGVRRPDSRRFQRRLLAVAAAAVFGLGLLAGREVWRYREGERVKDELILGLRVAGRSLRQVEERVRDPLEAVAEAVE